MARLWERSVAEPLFPPGAGLPVGHGPAPTWLAAAFGLSGFDLDVLVMAVAPELDLRYERLYGYLQDDVRRRRPTVDLALNLLCADAVERIGARSRFAPDAPLVRDRLLTVVGEPGESLLNRSLVPDEQVLRLLIGESTLDPRLAGFAELTRASGSPADLALAPVTGRALPPADAPRPRLYLEGEPASGRAEVAAALAAERGLPLLTVNLSQAAAGREPVAEVVRVAFRESWFRGTALLLTGVTDLPADDDTALAQAMADSRVPVFLAGEKPWRPDPPAGGTAVVPFPSPTARGRREVWQRELADAGLTIPDSVLSRLAGQYRLGRARIAEAVSEVTQVGPDDVPGALAAAARRQSGHDLERLAQRVEPSFETEANGVNRAVVATVTCHGHTLNELQRLMLADCTGTAPGALGLEAIGPVTESVRRVWAAGIDLLVTSWTATAADSWSGFELHEVSTPLLTADGDLVLAAVAAVLLRHDIDPRLGQPRLETRAVTALLAR